MRFDPSTTTESLKNAKVMPKANVAADGWRAHLQLRYGAKDEKTVLAGQHYTGPLMVQKPFYPEGPQTCHTYLIHPPGGVVAGDTLGLDVTMEPGSHAVITTPAAGKFYRSAGAVAIQANQLNVRRQAALEWLPQETIIYNQAKVRLRTHVHLEAGAGFIGWEMVCLGLPASGQNFSHGQVEQRFEVQQTNGPLLLDTLRIQDRDPVLSSRWGLAGWPVTGTMIATTGEHDLLSAIRKRAAKINASGLFSATQLNRLTVCRYLGGDVSAGFKYFLGAWEVLRPAVIGQRVCAPRIWAT